MKRFYYLATALLLLAGASSCKKNADVQDPEQQSSGRMIPFTVTAGQGGQKTSVSGKALVWDSGDQITVIPQGYSSIDLTLKGSGGSKSGEFDGEISDEVPDKTPLTALYKVNYEGGKYSLSVPDDQTYQAGTFEPGIFPSIGSSTYVKNGATSITFSTNPLGILRVTVKGEADEKLTSVSLRSYNPEKLLAGKFTIEAGTWAVSGGEIDGIMMDCGDVQLSAEGVQVNFVVPPFTFSSGELRVQAVINKNGTEEKLYTETNSSEVAITANNVTKIERTILLVKDVNDYWYNVCKIGSKYWMAENLRCNKFSGNLPATDYDATIIGQDVPIGSSSSSSVYTPMYWESKDADRNGYHYNWAAVVGVPNGRLVVSDPPTPRQGICPDKWHIPTPGEFDNLITLIEGTDGKETDTAGKYLKNDSFSTGAWASGNDRLDCYGFDALGSGVCSPLYYGQLSYAAFWTTHIYQRGVKSVAYRLSYNSDKLEVFNSAAINCGYSVRCVKD